MNDKGYTVNEIFYSIQGEGARAGTANIFVRFSGCNLQCSLEGEAGFDCDTEFTSGRRLFGSDIVGEALKLLPREPMGQIGVIFTGGEPTLQLDSPLIVLFREAGFYPVCLETNGLRPAPEGLNWISCSPKTAEHTLQVGHVNELRYVRRAGMGIPKPSLSANEFFLSPAVDASGQIHPADLSWCVKLCLEHPDWRLSTQQHKAWRIR